MTLEEEQVLLYVVSAPNLTFPPLNTSEITLTRQGMHIQGTTT